ncbi:uncharacterized protein IUM83_02183 [Phytophthora cinnamomi]|uniref:uncharacterized protein n=1 Tax=Phytophthora cinnamomi TaxID=4785 RepID=UPI003559DF1D|nr:hypothetical protein IUM83_02183 [Phytophthora cinnamomi]
MECKKLLVEACKGLTFVNRVAEVIREFDLVALQEMRGLEVLWLLKKCTGEVYKFQSSESLKKHAGSKAEADAVGSKLDELAAQVKKCAK